MNSIININEARKMRAKNFEGNTAQEVFEASKVFETWYKDMKAGADEASEKLKELIPVGTQMSLEFGEDSFLASDVETTSFNATDSALLDAIESVYPLLVTKKVSRSLSAQAKKDILSLHDSGSLDASVEAVLKINVQGTLKFKKDSSKKEEDGEEASE